MTTDRPPPEVVDPDSDLGRAIARDVAEFIAEVDARIARDGARLLDPQYVEPIDLDAVEAEMAAARADFEAALVREGEADT